MADQSSEQFGKLPNDSENFGMIPNIAEDFGNIRNVAERSEHHTFTVREVAKLFENAGVPRTERSIINWCQANRQGIARLDAFYDANERKYFLTPESVTRAIQEEKSKQAAGGQRLSPDAKLPNDSEEDERGKTKAKNSESRDDLESLQFKLRDLEINNRAKDYFIKQLQDERKEYVQQLVATSRENGELHAQILYLGSTPQTKDGLFPNRSENHNGNPTTDNDEGGPPNEGSQNAGQF